MLKGLNSIANALEIQPSTPTHRNTSLNHHGISLQKCRAARPLASIMSEDVWRRPGKNEKWALIFYCDLKWFIPGILTNKSSSESQFILQTLKQNGIMQNTCDLWVINVYTTCLSEPNRMLNHEPCNNKYILCKHVLYLASRTFP